MREKERNTDVRHAHCHVMIKNSVHRIIHHEEVKDVLWEV